jgi:hypothetical protein
LIGWCLALQQTIFQLYRGSNSNNYKIDMKLLLCNACNTHDYIEALQLYHKTYTSNV